MNSGGCDKTPPIIRGHCGGPYGADRQDLNYYENVSRPTDGDVRNSRKCVTIFIPTYKNQQLIMACVNSCLQQTYTNLRVVVIDNGYNELGEILKNDLQEFNDGRILYRPNTSNIGMQGNFWLILSLAQDAGRFIVVPADCLLSIDCIEKLVAAADKTPSANMVFPRTISRDIRSHELTAEITSSDMPLPWPHATCGQMSATKLIELFYSFHNLDSEWSHFTFIGALIDGSMLRSAAMTRYPMLDHGCEEYISLTLLSFSEDVVILPDPLLILYTNAARLGSAIRPGFNYTRYEPLHAEYYYLKTYEPLLIRRGIILAKLYFFLIIKTVYSIIRYPGPVYLLVPNVIEAALKLFLFVIPFEIIRYVKRHT